jgi:hypothetical protein
VIHNAVGDVFGNFMDQPKGARSFNVEIRQVEEAW